MTSALMPSPLTTDAPRWGRSPHFGRATGAHAGTDEQVAVRCLIVDDHPAIRAGLAALLGAEPDLEVIEAVATAETAAAVAEHTRVDVAIVDYQLGGRSGLWLARTLKRLPDPPAVLVYSAFTDHLLAAACVVAGADGLTSKAAPGTQLYDQVRALARGARRLPLIPPALGESLRRRLDPQEQAIFGLLLAGIPDAEIAPTVGISGSELDAIRWTMQRKLERLDPPPASVARARGEAGLD